MHHNYDHNYDDDVHHNYDDDGHHTVYQVRCPCLCQLPNRNSRTGKALKWFWYDSNDSIVGLIIYNHYEKRNLTTFLFLSNSGSHIFWGHPRGSVQWLIAPLMYLVVAQFLIRNLWAVGNCAQKLLSMKSRWAWWGGCDPFEAFLKIILMFWIFDYFDIGLKSRWARWWGCDPIV